MTTVNDTQKSSSGAPLQSSSPESREQLQPSSPDNTPLPPSSPAAAPPPAPDPTVEYGDEDIDDVLFDDREPIGSSSGRGRAVSNLQVQDKKQKMRLERIKKKRTVSLPVLISLYDGRDSDSNYNHLDPSKQLYVTILHDKS